jgi:excinuclease ABC subunit C
MEKTPPLTQKLDHIPTRPGVYLFKDSKGTVLYIGKAKVLRPRVRSYFQFNRQHDPKTRRLVARIRDLETIVTDSEVEALILEANLVKEYNPRYNINLKDDKSYPYIRVTREPFPRIFATRRLTRDGSRFFGPYTDVGSMKQLLKTIKKIFPIRSCKLSLTPETISQGKYKVCLAYHIRQCQGPCEGHISQQEYNRMVENIVQFIEGKSQKAVDDIRERMNDLAAEQRYEEAAQLRDQLNALETFNERQKVVDPHRTDRDIIATARHHKDACCAVFKVRDGKIIGRQHFYLQIDKNDSAGTITSAFIKQYYLGADFIPGEILLPVEIDEDQSTLKAWLRDKRQGSVSLHIPKRGFKAKLMEMCQKNADLLLQELIIQKETQQVRSKAVQALQEALYLEKPPLRIEAFDISNIQGSNPVASMVCFKEGKPAKSEYRRFRIKSKSTPDDFAMMYEAVKRRYSRLLREEKTFPDLILIDGGKGQLSAAVKALADQGIQDQPIIALAKRLDEVFLPGLPDPQNIRRDSPGLHLLQQVRDESHRFAVTYHRQLRGKESLESELDTIEGIGPVRRERLIQSFGSLNGLRNAQIMDIQSVDGISKELATKIWSQFHSSEDEA